VRISALQIQVSLAFLVPCRCGCKIFRVLQTDTTSSFLVGFDRLTWLGEHASIERRYPKLEANGSRRFHTRFVPLFLDT
jgi:hypothetical protein